MATVAVTRKDLEQFLPNQRTVRAFEQMVKGPADIQALQGEIDALSQQISDINSEITALNQLILDLTDYGTY